MEWISSLINGENGRFTVIAALAVLVGLVIAVKKGLVSFNGHGLKVGQDIETRTLIQSQFEYANAKIEGIISRLPSHLDVFHTKYVLARVEDVVQKSIIFNNMTDRDDYIKAKQELIYQTVMKRVTDPFFLDSQFKDFCYDFVKDLYTELYKMKKSVL